MALAPNFVRKQLAERQQDDSQFVGYTITSGTYSAVYCSKNTDGSTRAYTSTNGHAQCCNPRLPCSEVTACESGTVLIGVGDPVTCPSGRGCKGNSVFGISGDRNPQATFFACNPTSRIFYRELPTSVNAISTASPKPSISSPDALSSPTGNTLSSPRTVVPASSPPTNSSQVTIIGSSTSNTISGNTATTPAQSSSNNAKAIGGGAVAGIVVGALALLLLLTALFNKRRVLLPFFRGKEKKSMRGGVNVGMSAAEFPERGNVRVELPDNKKLISELE